MADELLSKKVDRPNWMRVWMGLLVLWATFTILGTWFNYQLLAVRGRPISWTQAIRMNIAAYGIWALLLTPVVLFLCAQIPLSRRHLFKLIPAHFFAISGIVVIDVFLKTLLAGTVFPGSADASGKWAIPQIFLFRGGS